MNGVIKKRSTIPGDPGNSVYDINLFLTDSQMQAELEKCEYCEEKPCMKACPCDCSPTDFIKAVSVGEPSDIMRSAALIMGKNPLGGICGQTCPEKHCMDACVHDKFDSPVNIPAVQAKRKKSCCYRLRSGRSGYCCSSNTAGICDNNF
jgi:hypothetical protein